MVTEMKRTVIKVTEWKKGCVFKTKTLGTIWVDSELTTAQQNEVAKANGGDFLGYLSTEEMSKGYDNCYRTVR